MRQKHRLTRREFAVRAVAVGAGVATAGCGGTDDGERTEPAQPVLSFGDTVEGEITDESPRDPQYDDLAQSYGLQRDAGDIVEIRMRSDEFDTHVLLADASGQMVTDAISTPRDAESRLLQRLTADGVYTIWAGSVTGTETGPFTLSLQRGAESSLIPVVATRISYGDTVDGQLTASAPLDPVYGDPGRAYTFEGSAGMAVRVRMESEDFVPFPVVTDQNGSLVSRVGEDGSDRERGFRTVLPIDGTYVIWAESERGTGTGSFRLSLSERDRA